MGNVQADAYAVTLNARISKEQAGRWAFGTVEDWANESHRHGGRSRAGVSI